jgi:hypothetical protein
MNEPTPENLPETVTELDPRELDATKMDFVAALSNVHDDESDIVEARQWAVDQLLNEQSLEQVHRSLLEHGWDAELADQITEHARIETRRQRGVITRDDIVRDLESEYRRATSGVSMFFFGGLMGRAARTFFAAVRTANRLRRLSRSRRERNQTNAER